MDGTSDGREEEAETPNPHTCSSSNRASIALAAIEQVWMVPAMEEKKKQRRQIPNLAPTAIKQVWMVSAMEERKKQKRQIHILALAAIKQVWMAPVRRNPNPHTRDTRHWIESKLCRTKNLMRPTPTLDFG